jgi:hypothetical protein
MKTREALECCHQSLTSNSGRWSENQNADRRVDGEARSTRFQVEMRTVLANEWEYARSILAKNVFTFCLCPETLNVDEFKSNGVIDLLEEILFLLHCCAEWGYIMAFTKVLTMYQIYRIWIHRLHSSYLSSCPLNSWDSFNTYHFFICICVYTYFAWHGITYRIWHSYCWLFLTRFTFRSGSRKIWKTFHLARNRACLKV